MITRPVWHGGLQCPEYRRDDDTWHERKLITRINISPKISQDLHTSGYYVATSCRSHKALFGHVLFPDLVFAFAYRSRLLRVDRIGCFHGSGEERSRRWRFPIRCVWIELRNLRCRYLIRSFSVIWILKFT